MADLSVKYSTCFLKLKFIYINGLEIEKVYTEVNYFQTFALVAALDPRLPRPLAGFSLFTVVSLPRPPLPRPLDVDVFDIDFDSKSESSDMSLSCNVVPFWGFLSSTVRA